MIGRWIDLAGEGAREVGADLLARYDEAHRRYHTRDHLAEVLDRIDELSAYADDADAVRLAAWFHDAVYYPLRDDNEEQSARLAEEFAGAEVARLVRLTKTHDPAPDDRNGAVLSDSDLAILAGSPSRYAEYAAGVRQEYGFASEQEFAAGRAAVLRALIRRSQIFRTPEGRRRFERDARHNIRTELELLAV